MNFAFSMSAVKQADAKPTQSLVEQIKAAQRRRQLRQRNSRPKTTEPETKARRTSGTGARQKQSYEQKAEIKSRKNSDNNPEEGYGNGSRRHCKDAELKNQLIQQLSTKTHCRKLLGHAKALEDFADVLVRAGAGAAAVRESGWTSLRLTVYRWLSLVLTNYSSPSCWEQSKLGWEWTQSLEPWSIKTGLDAYNTAWDTNTDGAPRPQSRYRQKRGYGMKTACLKVNISTSTSLSIRDYRRTRALAHCCGYVLQGLPKRIIASIERAIVIGDGLVDASDDHRSSRLYLSKLTPRLATFAGYIRINQEKVAVLLS